MNHKRKTASLLIVFLAISLFAFGQKATLEHVEPPQWWIGMNNPELTLLVHGKQVSDFDPSINYPGVEIKTVTRTENPNYLFIQFVIGKEAAAGNMQIDFLKKGKVAFSHSYILNAREEGSAERASFGNEDVVYLIMPDRFSNGDPSNDSVEGLKEKHNRELQGGRHGGDIQGIINQLDYLADLGVTAIWSTPLLEDDMATYSYHTYATTDYYKIDARFGSNEDYKRLADECEKRGIKLIMDMVPNHCGSDHWWMDDLPMSDWIHQYPEFTRTNYRMSTTNDPYASKYDFELNEKGWFDTSMPDLNQNNPFMLTYLKQFAIYWIEYAGLDGLRIDTYPYNDKWRAAEWTKAIREEYPNLNIMGECWQHRPSEIAYWQSGTQNYDGYDSYLPTVMDFPLNDALMVAFNEREQGWDKGLAHLYQVYIMDYLYADPYKSLVFVDNHDINRFAEQINFDVNKYKLAMAHLFTTRGIPQIYYGTEILMGGQKSKGDGDIRRNFPGGWPGDSRNAFTAEGRTEQENEVFNYTRTLMQYRKNNPVIHTGRFVHFVPENNVYVYFRMNEDKKLMVVLNNSDQEVKLELSRFEECLHGQYEGTDIVNQKAVNLKEFSLDAMTPLILELK